LGAMTRNGLQILLLIAPMRVSQAGCWGCVSWGSRLQMAFKYSYYLKPFRLPKLDARGPSIGGHGYKWPSSLLTTCSRASYLSWTLGGISWGHHYKWPFLSSYHLQPCRLPKLGTSGASVASHNYKWPSSPPVNCSCAGYPI